MVVVEVVVGVVFVMNGRGGNSSDGIVVVGSGSRSGVIDSVVN